MALEVFANNATATVASGGTDAPSAGTTETWTLSGSTLAAVSSSASPATESYVTDPAAPSEKIQVTSISGSTATVTRGADGTTPVAHASGFTIQQVLTRASLVALQGPTTTLGDTVYGGTGGVATRLPGSTSTTKQFLTQTGTGSVSAEPAWDTIAAADVPTLNQSTTGTAANVTGTVTVAHGGTGATTLTGLVKGNGASAMTAATAGTDYQAPITLTTTGSSGAATFSEGTLNIPQYSGDGGGGTSLAGVTVVAPSGTDDTSAINAALADGGVCQLGQATYYISAPITPTSGSALIGVQGGWSSVSDAYGTDNADNATGTPTGTIIQTLASFAGEAAILLDNESNSELVIGPALRNFYLDCSPMLVQTATWSVSGDAYSGNGIGVYGAVVAGTMEWVTVSKAQGSCYVFIGAQGETGTGYPDNWIIRGCKASSARANEFTGTGDYPGYGFYLDRCPDIVMSDCESSEHYGDGMFVFDVSNGMFSNCKSENNGSNGWHFVGTYGIGYYQNFVGCTSNYNSEHGFLFDDTGDGGGTTTGPGDWNMTGCKSGNDGQDGTGYAGFALDKSPDRVMLTGCFVDGNTQSYGILVSGTGNYAVIVNGGSYVKSGSQTFSAYTLASEAVITHAPTSTSSAGNVNGF